MTQKHPKTTFSHLGHVLKILGRVFSGKKTCGWFVVRNKAYKMTQHVIDTLPKKRIIGMCLNCFGTIIQTFLDGSQTENTN